MSSIENLEQRIKDLERNVGSAMGELKLTAVAGGDSSENYIDGMRTPIKIYPGKTINRVAVGVVNKNGEYVIREDMDCDEGIRVYIKDGRFVCDAVFEGGYCRDEWGCDIELLRHHTELYESLRSDIDKIKS